MKSPLTSLVFATALLTTAPLLWAHSSGPNHAHLLTRNFSSTISYDIAGTDGLKDPQMTISFSLLRALKQGGSVVGWDYTVTIQMPKGLTNDQRAISLYNVGAQGYWHNLTIIDADPAVEFYVPRRPVWTAGVGSRSPLIIEGIKPFLLGGPGINPSAEDNVAFVRNLQSGTYSFVLRLNGERPMHGAFSASPYAPSLDLGGGGFSVRSSHDNVPPPIPPGGSEER